MKKISFMLCAAALMLASTFTSCSKEDNSVYPDNIVIRNGYSLDSIYAQALEKATGDEITIQLPAGVEVFMKGDIEVKEGIKLNIIGDAAKPAKVKMKGGFITSNSIVIKNVKFTIDEAVKVPFIKMNTLPEEGLNEAGAFEIDGITLDGIEVTGLKNQLFYANKQKYCIKNFNFNNNVVAIKEASKKTIFDFNGGGLALNFNVTGSVIYADSKTAWQNGGLYSTQSGSKINQVTTEENVKQNFTFTGNTLYKISAGKTLCTLRENNMSIFTIADNKAANCGKKNEFIVGFGAGKVAVADDWQVSGNIVNWDGEDICEGENAKCKIENACVAGTVDVTPFEEPAAE